MAIQYIVSGDRGTKMGLLIEMPPKEGIPGDFYFFDFQRVKRETGLDISTSDKTLRDYLVLLKEDKLKGKDFSFGFRKDAAQGLSNFKGHWGGQ